MEKPTTDLSQGAIRRAVLSASLQHPSVVYPAALGIVGGIAAAVITASPAVIATAITATATAATALAVNVFLRHDRIASSYLQALRQKLAAEREERLADLASDLTEVSSVEGIRQLGRFVEKIETFQSVLQEKLSPRELTFERFFAIAEAVFLAGIDNLRAVHLAMKALGAIDEPYLHDRIGALESGAESQTPSMELKGLRDQLAQAGALHARVRERLGENELALAELDRATAAIGDMRTGSSRPTMDMETAMAELARIAERSSQYH